MKRIWQIAAKELLQNRRDGLAALFTILLPVLFTVFLGIIIGGATRDTFPLAVADEDGSATSRLVLEHLESSPLLDLKQLDPTEIDDAVKDQKAAAGLLIPRGFEAAVDAGETGTLVLVLLETSSGALSVGQAVDQIVFELNTGVLVARTAAEEVAAQAGGPVDRTLIARATSLAEAQSADPAVTVAVRDAGVAVADLAEGFDQSSTGGLVNWVLFGIVGVAGTTVWERRRGLLRRLDVAGVRGREIVGGKVLAMVIITLLQQLLLVIVGKFALGVDYFRSPGALILTMLSLSGLAASIGLLISVLFRSEQAVIATTVLSAQILAAMGGAWFPLEITSAGFSHAAHVLPSAWIMDSLHGIILKDWGVAHVLFPLSIVWGWIVVVLGLAIWRYRAD
jgi:ABC-2 type transport system permease protein